MEAGGGGAVLGWGRVGAGLELTLCVTCPTTLVLQAEKVLLFSQDTNLTSLLLEAKDLEARVIILSAR